MDYEFVETLNAGQVCTLADTASWHPNGTRSLSFSTSSRSRPALSPLYVFFNEWVLQPCYVGVPDTDLN